MGIHFRRTPMLGVIGVLALGGASVAWAQDTSTATRQDTSAYQSSQSQADTTQSGRSSAGKPGYNASGTSTDTALKASPGVQTGPSAQDTSRAAMQDTSSYRSSQNQTDTTQVNKSKSGYKYHGAATDTALKAEPGVQTGPSASDSGKAHNKKKAKSLSAADTVVCMDGSNSPNSAKGACGSHGGVDTVATWAALKARGYHPSGMSPKDSSSYKSTKDSSSYDRSSSSNPSSTSGTSSSSDSSSSSSRTSP